MRDISAALLARLKQPVQVPATNAEINLDLWSARPVTQLVDATFLESLDVSTSSTLTACDIAVDHPNVGRDSKRIFIAAIDNGIASVKVSTAHFVMDQHAFIDTGFSEAADDIAIAFDGTMPLDAKGFVEFRTEKYPWVFWCKDGALYGVILNANMQPVTLATENCTKVTAIRAPWALGASNDYGLCVFFLLSGAIYYRQLIGGEWKDAEAVSFGPANTVWSDIAATRTWDYRVCLQCIDGSGNVYDMFSRYFGVGNQINEHIDLSRFDANGNLIEVQYTDTKSEEHISLPGINATGAILYGKTALPVSAQNIEDASENWGTTVVITMTYPVSGGTASEFILKDSNNVQYACSAVSTNGNAITLTCDDFNLAGLAESISVIYTQGTLMSPAVLADSFTISFTPTRLVPPITPVPEPVSARSVEADGTKIAVKFSQLITSALTEAAPAFSVVDSEYEFVPGGALASNTKTPLSVCTSAKINTEVDLSDGTLTDTDASSGALTLAIDT